ncbi:MAG: VTT domain-containing protein [Acidobacteriaceae bacterium]
MALLIFLKPLGFWSVGVLAAIDASSLAIPMDLIIAGYVWSDRGRFWIYALVGALGASVGALVPFYIGRAGGEWVLEKRMNPSKFAQMRARFDRHHWFAVMVPAAMPPPFPFKLFAFGAGVFDMQVLPYMVSVFTGRAVHYMVTALLTFYFGPTIVEWTTHAAMRHSPLILASTAIVAAAFIVYVLHRRKRRRSQASAAASQL